MVSVLFFPTISTVPLYDFASPFLGNESNAQRLLYPNRFARDGVNNSDFLEV